MAEECPLGGAELWLPDEFLDDDFFSEEEKAAVAAKSESDEEDGLSRGLAGSVRGGDAGHAGKVGFLFGVLFSFWMVWSSRFAEHRLGCWLRDTGGGDGRLAAVHAVRPAGVRGGQPKRRRVACQLAAVVAAGADAGSSLGSAAGGCP
jgi:hypothetical protein